MTCGKCVTGCVADDCGEIRCLNCGWRPRAVPMPPTWAERPEPPARPPQHRPKKQRTLYARRYKSTEAYQAYLAYQKAYRHNRKKNQEAAQHERSTQ